METALSQTQLAQFYARNGCLRAPNPERLGDPSYRKGYEIRLIADDKIELRHIREALEQLDFALAKAFPKNEFQWVQPIYGRAQVERFYEVCQLEMPELLRVDSTSSDVGETSPNPPPESECADAK